MSAEEIIAAIDKLPAHEQEVGDTAGLETCATTSSPCGLAHH
jgi:hypothetical protein